VLSPWLPSCLVPLTAGIASQPRHIPAPLTAVLVAPPLPATDIAKRCCRSPRRTSQGAAHGSTRRGVAGV